MIFVVTKHNTHLPYGVISSDIHTLHLALLWTWWRENRFFLCCCENCEQKQKQKTWKLTAKKRDDIFFSSFRDKYYMIVTVKMVSQFLNLILFIVCKIFILFYKIKKKTKNSHRNTPHHTTRRLYNTISSFSIFLYDPYDAYDKDITENLKRSTIIRDSNNTNNKKIVSLIYGFNL